MIRVCLLHIYPKVANDIIKIVEKHNFQDDIMLSVIVRPEYSLEYFTRNSQYDILVIGSDYIKNNRNGIYVARRVKVINRKALIIFISSCEQDDLLEIINSEPFAYITENRLHDHFCRTLSNAISIINKDIYKFMYTKWNQKYEVSLKNVIYFSSSHRTIRYICIDGREDSFYEKMDTLEECITKRYSNYIRISQSYIVNLNYILSVKKNEISMIHGERLIVSRKYHSNLAQIIEKMSF